MKFTHENFPLILRDQLPIAICALGDLVIFDTLLRETSLGFPTIFKGSNYLLGLSIVACGALVHESLQVEVEQTIKQAHNGLPDEDLDSPVGKASPTTPIPIGQLDQIVVPAQPKD